MEEIRIPQALLRAIQKIKHNYPVKGNSWTKMGESQLEELFLDELVEWIRSKDPEELIDVVNLAMMLHDISWSKKGMALREMIDPTPENPRVLLIMDLQEDPEGT